MNTQLQSRRQSAAADRVLDAAPPSDPESERALLASLIVAPDNVDRIADWIEPADFGDADFGRLFDALRTMHAAGLPIDDVDVMVPELKRANVPESVREVAFLHRLLQQGIAAHAVYYAKQVRRAATLRRLQAIALDCLDQVTRPSADPQQIAPWLDAQLQTLGERIAERPRRLDDFAAEILAQLQQPDEQRTSGVMTGLPRLDESTGGWMPGELVILAARPGIGKTALALQVATYNALRPRPVLFVSLEMTGRELAARVLSGLGGVDSRRLRSGRHNAQHLANIERASMEVDGVPLRIWAPAAATLPRIRAMAKQDAAAGGLALLIVDYIGLVRPDDRTRPRHEQVAEVSAGLKALAKELSIPVLALCQLNREADGNEPRLSHLRESGAIEQDADLVLFIHRDAEKAGNTDAKLIVAKHRHGETGRLSLTWIPDRTRFEDSSGQAG